MNTSACTIRFVCPAFLGDARQQGAWRTPPFKAALRQWWRVLLAGRGMDWRDIRHQEADLFGNAWPDQKASKSRVRLRLSHWSAGRLSNTAPNVGRIDNGPNRVDGGLYLGYGAIGYDKASKGTTLEHAPAVDAGETAELRIGLMHASDQDAQDIAAALALMSRYATVGSRSRNAWGSFVLEGEAIAAAATASILIDWREALAQEWASGIGRDATGALIWHTEAREDWQGAVRALAQLRSDLDRTFSAAAERALLSYPVTKKMLNEWGPNARLPNSLRFKIVPDGQRLQGLVFHMPCRPKDELWRRHPNNNTAALEHLWQSVHQTLDAQLQRANA